MFGVAILKAIVIELIPKAATAIWKYAMKKINQKSKPYKNETT